MIDLFAACDSIDHEILVNRFEQSFGTTSKSLDWVKSCLTDRVQNVVIENSTSTCTGLESGVPERSVLGPRMYCMYTRHVGIIVRKHALLYHGYADDSHLIIKSSQKWHFVKAVCDLRMEKQVNAISKACHYQLSNIGQIR